MGRVIWIINDYAGSPYHGMEFRNYYFAKEWIKMRYRVYIVTASYMHLFKKLPNIKGNFTFETIDNINYIWVKVPKYGESTDRRRVLKWFIFTLKIFSLPIERMERPDIIIASPMAPFLALPTYRLAKKYRAKFIYEVKDIWPLSIIELGDISPLHPLIQLMSWCERFAIVNADYIISSLQNYGEHLRENLNIDRDFIWINNGVSLDEMEKGEPLLEEIREKIPTDKFIIGYTGTVGLANAIESLLESAKILKDYRDILFIVVGDGKEKKSLIEKYGYLENILFIDTVKKSQVQSLLKLFDVCYIGLKRENLFRYGVSPNKLFDYMYSAKPIIYAIDSGKNNIVKVAGCGITVRAENPNSIAKAIRLLYNTPKWKLNIVGENGRRYVMEHFTYKKLAKKFIMKIQAQKTLDKMFTIS